jgi:hypothetical protein
MEKLTKDQKIAFAEFLESEKERHMEDIAMINKKLGILAAQSIVATRVAPWVEDEDLMDFYETEELGNESPFGGYWRYQLNKVFDNSTGEDSDGFFGDD